MSDCGCENPKPANLKKVNLSKKKNGENNLKYGINNDKYDNLTTKLNTKAGVKSAVSAKLNTVLKGFLKVNF